LSTRSSIEELREYIKKKNLSMHDTRKRNNDINSNIEIIFEFMRKRNDIWVLQSLYEKEKWYFKNYIMITFSFILTLYFYCFGFCVNTHNFFVYLSCPYKLSTKLVFQILTPSHNYCIFNIFSFSQNNCHFTILMQHLLFFSTIIPLFIEFHLTYLLH